MDQSQLNSLDPKLKEAYDRVMGTAHAAAQSQPVSTPSSSTETVPSSYASNETPPTPVITTDTVSPTPTTPPETVNTHTSPTPSSSYTGNPAQFAGTDGQMQTFLAQEVAGAKQSLKMIQLFYIAGGIVFFVLYALFWMRFFEIAP